MSMRDPDFFLLFNRVFRCRRSSSLRWSGRTAGASLCCLPARWARSSPRCACNFDSARRKRFGSFFICMTIFGEGVRDLVYDFFWGGVSGSGDMAELFVLFSRVFFGILAFWPLQARAQELQCTCVVHIPALIQHLMLSDLICPDFLSPSQSCVISRGYSNSSETRTF